MVFIWYITYPCIPNNKDFLEIRYVTKAAILFLNGTASSQLHSLLSLRKCIILFKGIHLVYYTPLYSQ